MILLSPDFKDGDFLDENFHSAMIMVLDAQEEILGLT